MNRARPAALLATAALLLFLATALWTQFVRTDLDWVRATLSLYLHGPSGLALRAAYCVLAVAIALLGIALYRDSIGPRRSAAPLLFTVSALGLATVAIGDSWLPTPRHCWRRSSMGWRPTPHSSAPASACCCRPGTCAANRAGSLPPACSGAGPGWPSCCCGCTYCGAGSARGLGQKAVIVVIVGWLLYLALALYRRSRRTAAC